MPWSKLSDDFSDDLWTFSDRAFRLHVEAIVWSGRKLLDMRIPAVDLRRFARNAETVEEDAAELVRAGYWKRDGDAYLIVHHSKYQRTREAVINQQAANKANRAKAGKAPRSTRESKPCAVDPSHERSDESSEEMVGLGSVRYGSTQEQLSSEAIAFDEPPVDEQTGQVRGWETAVPGEGRKSPPLDGNERVPWPPRPYAGEGLRGVA